VRPWIQNPSVAKKKKKKEMQIPMYYSFYPLPEEKRFISSICLHPFFLQLFL
jgi:hypothetical protein